MRIAETQESYLFQLRRPARLLYKRNITREQFETVLFDIITDNLTLAWNQGLEMVGINPDQQTTEDKLTFRLFLTRELDHIPGLADAIISARNAEQPFDVIASRLKLWSNRYPDATNQAVQRARDDPKMIWIQGPTEQGCPTCSALNGKVKRLSQWQTAGYHPQDPPNPLLDCEGWQCLCRLEPTDQPITKGALPRRI